MKKKIIIIFSIIFLLGCISYVYINSYFIPVQLKSFIQSKLTTTLNRPVTIGAIHFDLLKGFSVNSVEIKDKINEEQTFISLDKISFRFFFPTLFKDKTILIPSIIISKPTINLIRAKDNTWNFSDLLRPSEEKSTNEASSINLLLRKVLIEDGQISVEDSSQEKHFYESLKNLNILLVLSLNKGIHFQLKANTTQIPASVTFKGKYDLKKRTLDTQLDIENLNAAYYISHFNKNPNIAFHKGIISAKSLKLHYEKDFADLTGNFIVAGLDYQWIKIKRIKGNFKASNGHIVWKDRQLNLSGSIFLSDGDLALNPERNVQGSAVANIQKMTIIPSLRKITLAGDLSVTQAAFQMNPRVRINGNLKANNIKYLREEEDFSVQADYEMNNGFLKMDPQGEVRADGTAQGLIFAKKGEALSMLGDYNLREADFNVFGGRKLSGNIISNGAKLVWDQNHFDGAGALSIDQGFFAYDKDRQLKGNFNIPSIRLIRDGNNYNLKTLLNIANADAALSPTLKLTGNTSLDLNYQHTPNALTPFNYQALLKLSNATLLGAPRLETIQNINGALSIEPHKVESTNLSFFTNETDISLTGSIRNFKRPLLDLKIDSPKAELPKVIAFFPDFAKKSKLMTTGHAEVTAFYKGYFDSPLDADLTLKLKLKNASASNDKLPEGISNMVGIIEYKKDFLRWIALRGKFRNEFYTLNGELNDFNSPLISTRILSDSMDVNVKLNLSENRLRISALKGRYLNSDVNIQGHISFEDKDQSLFLNGHVDLNLSDISKLNKNLKTKLKSLNPDGSLALDGSIEGQISNWRNWQITLKGESPLINLMGHPLTDVIFKFTQKNYHIEDCDLFANLYGGPLTLTSSANLQNEFIPIDTLLKIESLDLELLRKEKKLKTDNLSGKMAIILGLNGPLLQVDELKGNGSLSITEGHLWQWNIVEGIFSALLIPEFKTVVFTDASADFVIKDKKFITNNVVLVGKTVDLKAKGWIDFSQNLNFDVSPKFSEITLTKSESLRKAPTSFLTQIVQIKLTGTLNKPEYKVSSIPMKIIGNTTNVIKEGIKGVVDEIF